MKKNKHDIKIRNAKKKDCKDIFKWRNDRVSREMSHTSEIINWGRHCEWFCNSLGLESRILLICENSCNEKIALISFDISELKAVISINLNPIHRGKGLGKLCLEKAIKFFYKEFSEIKNLSAEIKKENIASKKIFLAAGFKKYNTKDNIEFMIKY